MVKYRITNNFVHNSTTRVFNQLTFYNITGYNF